MGGMLQCLLSLLTRYETPQPGYQSSQFLRDDDLAGRCGSSAVTAASAPRGARELYGAPFRVAVLCDCCGERLELVEFTRLRARSPCQASTDVGRRLRTCRPGWAPAACRAAHRCSAWFWCKDSGRGDCLDQQSGTWVPWHGCKLLALPVLPAPLVDPAALAETSEASLFRSFAAGYIKRAPPRRALTHPAASTGFKIRPVESSPVVREAAKHGTGALTCLVLCWCPCGCCYGLEAAPSDPILRPPCTGAYRCLSRLSRFCGPA